jgi:hypothetical protein
MNLFDRMRFTRLKRTKLSRELSAKEEVNWDELIQRNPTMKANERDESLSLNLLRDASPEPVVSARFTETAVRKIRLDARRNSLSYWSPALVGAGIAALACLTIFQLLSSSPSSSRPGMKNESASLLRSSSPIFPEPNFNSNQSK